MTANLNLRSPGYVKAVRWIGKIWNELPEDILINSYLQCGIHQSLVPGEASLLHKTLQVILDHPSQPEPGYVVDHEASNEIDVEEAFEPGLGEEDDDDDDDDVLPVVPARVRHVLREFRQ